MAQRFWRLVCMLRGHAWCIAGDWREQSGLGPPAPVDDGLTDEARAEGYDEGCTNDAVPPPPPSPWRAGFSHGARYGYAGWRIRVQCANCHARSFAHIRKQNDADAWRAGKDAAEWEMAVPGALFGCNGRVVDAPPAAVIAAAIEGQP